jgi:hypothetical protein
MERLRTLDSHRMRWSITVTSNRKIQAVIASIPDNVWIDIEYTASGEAIRAPVGSPPVHRLPCWPVAAKRAFGPNWEQRFHRCPDCILDFT